jgi:hypothetical protein
MGFVDVAAIVESMGAKTFMFPGNASIVSEEGDGFDN